jgi:hypothetical protein
VSLRGPTLFGTFGPENESTAILESAGATPFDASGTRLRRMSLYGEDGSAAAARTRFGPTDISGLERMGALGRLSAMAA